MNKILIGRRAPLESLPGWWEFPGGKPEKGESNEEAIKREMNSRKNPKQIQSLKSARERILNQYRKMKSKINKYEY